MARPRPGLLPSLAAHHRQQAVQWIILPLKNIHKHNLLLLLPAPAPCPVNHSSLENSAQLSSSAASCPVDRVTSSKSA